MMKEWSLFSFSKETPHLFSSKLEHRLRPIAQGQRSSAMGPAPGLAAPFARGQALSSFFL